MLHNPPTHHYEERVSSYNITATLTSVHDSIELHWHADAVCAVGGEVQGWVLPAICEKDKQRVQLC